MENDDSKEQQRRVSNFTPPGNLDRGALAHAFMTVNNQDEEGNPGNKIISITSRQSSRASSNPASQQAEEKQDPSAALRDLRLPDNLFNFLRERLKNQGFGEIRHEKIESLVGTRQYTYLPRKDNQQDARYFIYIPNWIIDNLTPANADALAALGLVFKLHIFLLVVHSGFPDGELKQIIEDGWERYNARKLVFEKEIWDLEGKTPTRQKFILNTLLSFKDT